MFILFGGKDSSSVDRKHMRNHVCINKGVEKRARMSEQRALAND